MKAKDKTKDDKAMDEEDSSSSVSPPLSSPTPMPSVSPSVSILPSMLPSMSNGPTVQPGLFHVLEVISFETTEVAKMDDATIVEFESSSKRFLEENLEPSKDHTITVTGVDVLGQDCGALERRFLRSRGELRVGMNVIGLKTPGDIPDSIAEEEVSQAFDSNYTGFVETLTQSSEFFREKSVAGVAQTPGAEFKSFSVESSAALYIAAISAFAGVVMCIFCGWMKLMKRLKSKPPKTTVAPMESSIHDLKDEVTHLEIGDDMVVVPMTSDGDVSEKPPRQGDSKDAQKLSNDPKELKSSALDLNKQYYLRRDDSVTKGSLAFLMDAVDNTIQSSTDKKEKPKSQKSPKSSQPQMSSQKSKVDDSIRDGSPSDTTEPSPASSMFNLESLMANVDNTIKSISSANLDTDEKLKLLDQESVSKKSMDEVSSSDSSQHEPRPIDVPATSNVATGTVESKNSADSTKAKSSLSPLPSQKSSTEDVGLLAGDRSQERKEVTSKSSLFSSSPISTFSNLVCSADNTINSLSLASLNTKQKEEQEGDPNRESNLDNTTTPSSLAGDKATAYVRENTNDSTTLKSNAQRAPLGSSQEAKSPPLASNASPASPANGDKSDAEMTHVLRPSHLSSFKSSRQSHDSLPKEVGSAEQPSTPSSQPSTDASAESVSLHPDSYIPIRSSGSSFKGASRTSSSSSSSRLSVDKGAATTRVASNSKKLSPPSSHATDDRLQESSAPTKGDATWIKKFSVEKTSATHDKEKPTPKASLSNSIKLKKSSILRGKGKGVEGRDQPAPSADMDKSDGQSIRTKDTKGSKSSKDSCIVSPSGFSRPRKPMKKRDSGRSITTTSVSTKDSCIQSPAVIPDHKGMIVTKDARDASPRKDSKWNKIQNQKPPLPPTDPSIISLPPRHHRNLYTRENSKLKSYAIRRACSMGSASIVEDSDAHTCEDVPNESEVLDQYVYADKHDLKTMTSLTNSSGIRTKSTKSSGRISNAESTGRRPRTSSKGLASRRTNSWSAGSRRRARTNSSGSAGSKTNSSGPRLKKSAKSPLEDSFKRSRDGGGDGLSKTPVTSSLNVSPAKTSIEDKGSNTDSPTDSMGEKRTAASSPMIEKATPVQKVGLKPSPIEAYSLLGLPSLFQPSTNTRDDSDVQAKDETRDEADTWSFSSSAARMYNRMEKAFQDATHSPDDNGVENMLI